MFQKLKTETLEANLLLPKYNLIKFTWGNVSVIDREQNVVAIKPSGVSYEDMSIDDIVVVNLDGDIIEGKLKPSSDLKTHLQCYKKWNNIGSVVHTHSPWATSWAQAGKDIISLGTTQADYFYGSIPCTPKMTKDDIFGDYEKETGNIITTTFEDRNINPLYVPGVLVYSHGVFAWGKDGFEAVHNAVVIEECAMMAYNTTVLSGGFIEPMQNELLDKHFLRKHGINAYYGQVLV